MLLFFLIGTTLFTHYICLWMTRIREQKLSFAMRECEKPHRKTGNSKEEKKLLIFGILVLLGVLGYLKYHNFFVANWNILADRIGFISPLQEKELLIPIGISFYTLQAIGYMADVYWSKAEVYPHPGKIALFLGFFPQIMEGPISSYTQTVCSCRYDLRQTGGLQGRGDCGRGSCLYDSVVFGIFGVYGYRDRKRKSVRHPTAGEFQTAVFGGKRLRFLEAVAHDARRLVPHICVLSCIGITNNEKMDKVCQTPFR